MAGLNQEKVQLPLRTTPVVTCFLMRVDGPAPLLLLVRRSQKVGSYHAQWAGISGFIEEGVSPEEQAYTEMHEEASLQRTQVHLLKRGAVVEHVDTTLGRRWLVHPFLVEVLQPAAIQLDWEAVEMRWIAPEELSNYETVPKLREAFLSASNGEALP